MTGIIFLFFVGLNLVLYHYLIRDKNDKLHASYHQITRKDKKIKELEQTITRMVKK